MSRPRKTPILLRRGPLSGEVMALYSYNRHTAMGRDVVQAHYNGKQSVQADYDALMLEELIAEDAEDIVGILDGVADGESLTDEERAQVRAFRERLRAACERHNTALDAAAEKRAKGKIVE